MTISKKRMLIFSVALGLFSMISIGSFGQGQQPGSGVNPMLRQDTSTTPKVSDNDLKRFASIYPDVVEENQKAQQKMVGVIEQNGLKLDRFNEIQQARMQNQKTDETESEKKKMEMVTQKLNDMQPELQKGLEKKIEDGGMTMQQYQKIAAAVQSDQRLLAKLQQFLSPGSQK